MKKLLLLAALVAVAFMPAVAQADTVKVGDIVQVQPGASRYDNGGEFTLTDLSTPQSFTTFCVETNEFLAFGESLTVASITTNAINGGVSGGSPDPLDSRTAFIYTQYRYGNPYGWTGSEVQHAIWYIENEAGDAPLWVTDGHLADYITAQGWTGLGGVRVLNLTRANGELGQDLLTIPDGGATLALLGCALLGLVALRAKLRV